MLKETVSSVGRWAGLPEKADATTEPERRVWIRYPSNAEASCRTLTAAEEAPVAARVHNISRGGINLLVNRWFEPGMLLKIQLPAATRAADSTVLAYVVRSTPQEAGEWVLGCTFATELNAEDLEPLGVHRIRPEPPDQRSWERFPCDLRVTYQALKTDSPDPTNAMVADISPLGIGLLVTGDLEIGTLLHLELRNIESEFHLVILASVVRVNARTGCASLVGCNFIRELTHQELKALL